MNTTPNPENTMEADLKIIRLFADGSLDRSNNPIEFSQVFEEVKRASAVASILSQGSEELEHQLKNLTYAKAMLDDNIYNAIGEKAIKAPGMTLDKIAVIAWGDIEFDVGGLRLETVEAMTGEYLAHPGMTTSKLSVLRASPEDIMRIGPRVIAEMSKERMEEALRVSETK